MKKLPRTRVSRNWFPSAIALRSRFHSSGHGLFAAPLAEGSPWTWGIIGGWIIQIFAFLITGVYTARANGEFDSLIKSIVAEATK